MTEHRVVVSGIGLVSVAGLGLEAAWEQVRSGPLEPTPFTPPPPADELTFPAFQTPEYDLAEAGVPERCRRWIVSEDLTGARDLKHMLASTALALRDAGLDPDCSAQDPPVAVVAANESPGFEQLSQRLFELGTDGDLPGSALERYKMLVGEFFQLNTFLLPYFLARAFHFGGLSLFVNSACTSGLNALEVAAQQIRSGASRIAVIAASDNPLSLAKFMWFHEQGLYAMDGVIRPFDPEQSGTVFGDGGTALVLEDLDHARQRGARPYAELLGTGFAQDGWKISVPAPTAGKALQALESSLRTAGVTAEEVDLVAPHGVGAPASDQYESITLRRLFGERESWPVVTTLKPMLGHNLGGSAVMELALLMASMREGWAPPTFGHQQPYPRYPMPVLTEWRRQRIEIAAKLTCGFAGFYGAAVLRNLET